MREIELILFRSAKLTMSKCIRSTMLALLGLCFIGLQSAEAQIVHPVGIKGKTVKHKIEKCEGANVQYTDDNSVDGLLYADAAVDKDGKGGTGLGRTDTVEICPEDRWHYTTVTFTEFDIDFNRDFLRVYDGSYDSLRADGATATYLHNLTGYGVSNANGGWVAASCSPDINPTGCLTFVFNTTLDNRKGTGWDAWVTCEDRDIKVKVGNITSQKIECSSTITTANVSIPAPTIEAVCGNLSTRPITLRIRRANGTICTTMQFPGGIPAAAVDLGAYGVGAYTAEWFVTADPKKTTGRKVFSVSLPALVCNDDVNIPLGSGCGVEISPDDVLENQCDPLPTYLAYNVTVKLGSGAGLVLTGSGANAASGSLRAWPIITKELIEEAAKKSGADIDICKGTAEVTIERVYTPDAAAAVCHNGVQKTTCTTTVHFKDEMAPVATASLKIGDHSNIDTLIACDVESLKKLIKIGAVDNCDIRDTSITITLEENDPCFNATGMFGADTTRAFVKVTATDYCNNTGTYRDTFIILRPQFFAKPKNGKFECSENGKVSQLPGLRVGYVIQEGARAGESVITDTIYKLSTEEYYCGYILVNRNVGGDVPDTDCGTKEFIEWSVLDWCTPGEGLSVIDTQFIEYIDTEAPLFVDTMATRVKFEYKDSNDDKVKKDVKTTASTTVELDHFSCTFESSKLTKPRAKDNCDANPSVAISRVFRIEDGSNWPLKSFAELDCDSFYVEWTTNDICHEQQDDDKVYQIVVVKDVTKPSAACIDRLNVSLSNEWGAKIYADDVDAGSYDACGIKSKLIRIKGSGDDFAEYVLIGCEYVHPDLQIEMQVTDHKDNVNICWLDVTVEDKINPICTPLDDVEEDCDKYHNGELGTPSETYVALTGELEAFYNAHFGNPKDLKKCEDNLNSTICGTLEYEQEYQLTEWPCGEIKAKRRYRAIDWSGLKSGWAVQDITITYKANWKITFPADYEGSCGDMAPAESIVINNGACDLLGYEVTEKQYDIPGDACFKIERTYHVINWCKYEAGQEPIVIARVEGDHNFSEERMITSEGNEDSGYWTYIQVLKVHDTEAPVVTIVNPEPCINGIEFDALPYGEEDITPGSSPYECDEPKTWTATATDCSNNISWVGKLYNASTGDLVKEVESHEITYVVSNKESYYAEFWAYDNCGNSGGEKGDPVKFWDCKKPTPYVLNGVAVELMQTGMVQVWASDLNQNSFDNCTDQSKLDMRIWADFLGDAPEDLAGVQALGKVITFPCDRVGTNVVYIYVIDEEGNWDFAQTYVIVQDNMNACETIEPGNGGMVAGTIVNPQGENVESVEVSITGAAQQSITTGADGHFMFMMNAGENYTVTPVKDINPLNGVSTFDLVLISKHILGINSFDSPYKYIAADVNKSGSITAFDMVQLRQLILNITTEFPGNDSWRFVDASHQFTSANAAAEDFSEFYTINTLAGNMENVDFVGVKIGDVNGNAKANSLLGADTRSTNGALTLTTADRFVEAGETVTVAFNAADIANAQGYQFTLNFAGQGAEIVEGVAKAANFNTATAQRGVIATSWNGEATANDVLFAMTFNATASGMLSELVSVSSDLIDAEAYNTANELLDVNLEFTAAAVAGFELAQNSPNPFNGVTTIGFNLPTAGAATLKVMDAQGKVLKAITADYAKGANQVSLNANELGATGVLYYQLESADQVATKKMIIIE